MIVNVVVSLDRHRMRKSLLNVHTDNDVTDTVDLDQISLAEKCGMITGS